MSRDYRYSSGERLPVEVLVFEVAPEHVEEFLAVDHEVWTLGEAHTDGFDHVPFLSKEVWLDDAHPGRIVLTFVWESIESWRRTDRSMSSLAKLGPWCHESSTHTRRSRACRS